MTRITRSQLARFGLLALGRLFTPGALAPLALLLSGTLALILWPPPSFAIYEDLNWILRLIGWVGVQDKARDGARALVGWSCLALWLFAPHWAMRLGALVLAVIMTGLLVLGFLLASGGAAAGAWMIPLFCGLVAIDRLPRPTWAGGDDAIFHASRSGG